MADGPHDSVSGMHRVLIPLWLIPCLAQQPDSFPKAEIRNQAITARIYLPDAARGYYRGTRFDWSGNTYSLRTANHEYFGQWFPAHDPKLHDAIMGPVEEFRTADGGLGYADAKPGGTFVRIGVGVVRKPDDKPYQSFQTYDIVDHGKWKVKTGRDAITFVHELKSPDGYGYHYTKTMRLVGGAAHLRIEHALRNTGRKPIDAQQYNHNFFVIDGQPTGPAVSVKFPFTLQAKRPFEGDLAEVEGGEIRYRKELGEKDRVFGEFAGFGATAADYDLRIENRKAGAGVRIRGDRPLAKIIYWSIRTVFSPEPYIDIQAAPGETMRWTYDYEFYDLPK